MPRTVDSVIQAVMVMAVIVMSPYAMFATKGCPGGSRGDGAPERTGKPPWTQEVAVPEGKVETDARPADRVEEAATSHTTACRLPELEIPRTEGCASNEPYPGCKWQIPDPGAQDPAYAIWRYTTPSNRWGRPALVALALSSAHAYHELHPKEPVTIGDLDAPGDRHKTHAQGVDVDMYLPGRMAAENMGLGRYPDNYKARSASFVRKCRGRVLELAKILAACTQGRVRIYYNDPKVLAPFLEWFGKQGLTTPFEAPMMPHNELHRFHFHVTIPEDLPVMPASS